VKFWLTCLATDHAVPSTTVETTLQTSREVNQARKVGIGGSLLRLLVKAAVVVGLLSLLSLLLLAVADYDQAGNGSPDLSARAAWVWVHGDHVHFAVHMAAARVLDVCPCTRRAAATQYYRAHFHAVTPHQAALAADSRPRTMGDWAEYVVGPFTVGFDWLHDAATWIAGQRPTQQATVLVEEIEFAPAEIHVTRGTTVTWRNVDELGEAHTVTADPGQTVTFDSDWLEPDESFSFTFTERGRFVYYCQAYGAPDHQGMSGVVVVS